jgi:acyl carrier protein
MCDVGEVGVTTPASVEAALYAALAESRGSTPEEARSQVADGGAIDSLEGVGLVIAAEEAFGVRIEDEELTPSVCSSIPELVELVMSKIGSPDAEEGHADERS